MKALIISGSENKLSWNNFLLENSGSFLQSFEWGDFQEKMAKKALKLAVEKGGERLAQALVIKESFPLGFKNCFYLPFGPCFKKNISHLEKQEILEKILNNIKEFSKKEKAVFLKIEPEKELSFPKNFIIFNSQKRVQPQKTIFIDLTKPEHEILKSFDKGVSYNIRLANKKGLKIIIQDKYNPAFYKLIKNISNKKEFTVFLEKHYQELFNMSSGQFKVRMFLANFKQKIIATYIVIGFGNSAACLHGAVDSNYRGLKPSEFLVWERIKWAKSNEYEKIDLWGIDEKKWPGITNFKKGFNGKEHIYPNGKEIVFEPFWYKFYSILKKVL